MMRILLTWTVIIFGVVLMSCSKTKIIQEKAALDYVQEQLNKLAPVDLNADLSQMSETEQLVLKKLVQAAQYMDEIFLEQVYEKNHALRAELKADPSDSTSRYLEFFTVMFGPWNRLPEGDRHNVPFINQAPKPDGANFYPPDLNKEEFNTWLEAHPEDREAFESNFTVIRRQGKALVAIPYSEAYQEYLTPAAALLREAAALTADSTLARYLRSRADAFTSNDYYQSDMDWMDLAGDIEVVIGPYEVYEDNLFNYKAAFESFITIVDQAESEKLTSIAKYLNDMEKNLPIPDKYKNFNRGSSSPIKIVNEIFSAGDTKAGIQTTAFNLPNDERVREAKGSKKVMLKNVAEAKFNNCWIPIVNKVLAMAPLSQVSFDAYFNHVLMHEISHGLGPGTIKLADGTTSTVNKELKETYSIIEECKADVLGFYNLKFMIDKGVFDKALEKNIYASYLGGMFRSIRFGINEAHGGGVAIQMNYLLEKGAFTVDKNGLFDVNNDKLLKGIKALAGELLLIQAQGNYAGAKALIEKYRKLTPEVQAALDRLQDVPVDIRPQYAILETL